MRLRTTATVVMALAGVMAGCSDDTSTESEGGATTSAPAQVSTPERESGANGGDEGLQALQERLAAEGLDESLATFGVEWCRHQDLAMLSRDVGGMELAEQVSAAAAETAC